MGPAPASGNYSLLPCAARDTIAAGYNQRHYRRRHFIVMCRQHHLAKNMETTLLRLVKTREESICFSQSQVELLHLPAKGDNQLCFEGMVAAQARRSSYRTMCRFGTTVRQALVIFTPTKSCSLFKEKLYASPVSWLVLRETIYIGAII